MKYIDVQRGEYAIKNVPHVELSKPTPNGNKYVMDAETMIKVSRLYYYMKRNGIHELDYTEHQSLIDDGLYRISESQREAWKRANGRLTGLIPHGDDGETLSEYIARKRREGDDK
jgi:hypothetical protein